MSEKPLRVQLCRTKGWRMPANTVRVSRPSIYGNPFNATQSYIVFPPPSRDIGQYLANLVQLRTKPSLERCIDFYIVHLREILLRDPDFLEPLRGKNLACWCALDQPCHAEILLDLANR